MIRREMLLTPLLSLLKDTPKAPEEDWLWVFTIFEKGKFERQVYWQSFPSWEAFMNKARVDDSFKPHYKGMKDAVRKTLGNPEFDVEVSQPFVTFSADGFDYYMLGHTR